MRRDSHLLSRSTVSVHIHHYNWKHDQMNVFWLKTIDTEKSEEHQVYRVFKESTVINVGFESISTLDALNSFRYYLIHWLA